MKKNQQSKNKTNFSQEDKKPEQKNIIYSINLSNGIIATNPDEVERQIEYSKNYYL